MNKIIETLMRRDDMTFGEAKDILETCKARVLDNGEDPQDVLQEECGLEPDYIFDLF